MSDYYVGMKHDTFLAHNKNNICHSEIVCSCECGHLSEYQWNDGGIIFILWQSRMNQLRVMYIEERKGANRS